MNNKVRMIVMEPITTLRESIISFINHDYSSRIEIVGIACNLCELRLLLVQQPFDIVLTELYGKKEDFKNWWDFHLLFSRLWSDKKLLVWTRIPGYYLHYLRFFDLKIKPPIVMQKKASLIEFKDILNSLVSSENCDSNSIELSFNVSLGKELTNQELLILWRLFEGESLTNIAYRSGKSVKTVSNQKRSAMRKLGIINNHQLYFFNKEFLKIENVLEIKKHQ